MEKKTKKLQLRKETIAVLNGERMSHVVGGMGVGCQMNGLFYENSEVLNNDGNECVCINGNWECQPMDGETHPTLITTTVTLLITKATCYIDCND